LLLSQPLLPLPLQSQQPDARPMLYQLLLSQLLHSHPLLTLPLKSQPPVAQPMLSQLLCQPLLSLPLQSQRTVAQPPLSQLLLSHPFLRRGPKGHIELQNT